MISEEKPNGNGDGKETPQVCGACAFWQPMLINPHTHQACGACANQAQEDAPFGVITASFGSCSGWGKKKEQTIIKAPQSVIRRLGNRF